MNAHKQTRAMHQAREHETKATRLRMKAAGAMQLHRIVDLEAGDYCAQEGGYVAPAPAPRIPRERKASSLVGPLLGLLSILLVALAATAALVWP